MYKKLWYNIPVETCRKLISSMRRKIDLVPETNSGYTGYWLPELIYTKTFTLFKRTLTNLRKLGQNKFVEKYLLEQRNPLVRTLKWLYNVSEHNARYKNLFETFAYCEPNPTSISATIDWIRLFLHCYTHHLLIQLLNGYLNKKRTWSEKTLW